MSSTESVVFFTHVRFGFELQVRDYAVAADSEDVHCSLPSLPGFTAMRLSTALRGRADRQIYQCSRRS